MEAKGVYSAHMCTEHYEPVARSIATEAGAGDHKIIVLPSETNMMKGDDVHLIAERVVREAFGV